MAKENKGKKCAHPACSCVAREGSKYCSQYCQDSGGTMEISCGCGHKGCAVEAEGSSMPASAS
jgi:hypothetical protein